MALHHVFIGDKTITTEFWLHIANSLASKQKASAVVLALLLFFIAASTGFTEMVKDALRNIELPPYAVAIGLLVFCYAIALLIIFSITWVIPRSIGLLNSGFALLARRCHLLRSTYGANRRAKRQIVNAIASLSPQEKAFLELFCSDGIAIQRMACELLPHQTYGAHQGLIRNGLLTKIKGTEHFALAADAIPSLRRLFYGGKRPCTEIELPLDRLASSGSSGSPPTGGGVKSSEKGSGSN